MPNSLVIFHAVCVSPLVPCRDGLVSSYCAHKALIDPDYLGWHYRQNDSNEFPDVSDYQNIFILDFHFPKHVLEAWLKAGKTVHLIDHHESTLNSLGSFTEVLQKRFRYDIKECGATLAWKYFFPYDSQPVFLKYIRDRDLYDKELPFTEEIHCAFSKLLWKGSLKYSFEFLDGLSEMSEQEFLDFMVPIGSEILEKKREKLQKIIKKAGITWVEVEVKRPAYFVLDKGFKKDSKGKNYIELETLEVEDYTVETYRVPMIKLLKSYEQYRSDIGEWIYKQYPEAAFVILAKATGGFSLRSDKKAKNFNILTIPGVEGHRNAGSTPELNIRELTVV